MIIIMFDYESLAMHINMIFAMRTIQLNFFYWKKSHRNTPKIANETRA